jgi:hypothetical protein
VQLIDTKYLAQDIIFTSVSTIATQNKLPLRSVSIIVSAQYSCLSARFTNIADTTIDKMSQQAPSESPKPNSTPSRGSQSTGKRKHGEVRIAGATDQFPDVPWYNLDYQHIVSQVNDMLDGVILGLEKYVATDSAIKELVEAAEKAKKLPDLEKCRLAVLGQQAAGKSTLISALLDRTLLETSGGGKACTSVPTAIIHKAGAGDNTRKSDVKIEWLSEEQHPAHVLEHIQRWGDVYPGTRSEEQDVSGEQDRDASEAAKSNTKPEKTSPNTLEQIEGAASTAKEFFEIIFDVEHDKDAKTFFEDRLCNRHPTRRLQRHLSREAVGTLLATST